MREPELRPRARPIPRSPRVDPRAQRARKRSFLGGLFRLLLPRRASDGIALLVAVTATAVVFVNALALQQSTQPAPASAPVEMAVKANVPLPPKRSVPASPSPMLTPSPVPTINSLVPPANVPLANVRTDSPAVKARVEMIVTVQRELAQRGYYDGAFDGLPGPRTEQAIKEFEQANGLRVTGDVNEQLLTQIRKARHRSEITGSISRTAEPKQSTQILGVQRTLARLGYGPVKFSGLHDAATRSAIERFERDRGLPATGEITPKLQSELSLVTGASLD